MNVKDSNMTIPQHDLTKQWNCYMFFHRAHETHFSAMKYSLFLLPKLECFIITDTCIFLFFASRVSLVLRWVQQSSGTCFNRWVTCIWIQLRLHNNLILISMDFLMETLWSRMMTSRNTIFFSFPWLRIHIIDVLFPSYPTNFLWETKKKTAMRWFVLSFSIPLYF